ncbi:MAG: thiol-disulfide oxidoreductase DCC family protein [Pseudobdellovibrionaceae bacterium]
MNTLNPMKGAIYFDGLCMACSAEINHYRKLPGSETFDFIDITAQTFKAEDHGLDPAKVHKVMHVRDSNGVLHEGVDAFRTIWKGIPRYQFLARLSENKLVRWTLEQGYKSFVVIRPYLPRKKMDCSASPYCETPN